MKKAVFLSMLTAFIWMATSGCSGTAKGVRHDAKMLMMLQKRRFKRL